jgi:hypothetical protein
VLYHTLAMPPTLLCISYFLNTVSHFCNPSTCAFCVAGIRDWHHTRLTGWDGVSLTFCQSWPQTVIFPISTSWVPGITGVHNHAWPCIFLYYCAYYGSVCRPPSTDCRLQRPDLPICSWTWQDPSLTKVQQMFSQMNQAKQKLYFASMKTWVQTPDPQKKTKTLIFNYCILKTYFPKYTTIQTDWKKTKIHKALKENFLFCHVPYNILLQNPTLISKYVFTSFPLSIYSYTFPKQLIINFHIANKAHGYFYV